MFKPNFSTVAGVKIPDSKLAAQATDLLLQHGNEFIYNHSLRVFIFGSLKAQHETLKYDPELLYISAVFHDLGLTPHYSSPDKRFEVDGANAARSFLQSQGISGPDLQLVWDAIALHTTIGVAEYKEAEVALLYAGVGLDVMGEGYGQLRTTHREDIVNAFPRNGFKQKIIPAFFDGFKHKTDTTFGNIKADVCAYMIPHFHRKNFVEAILESPWSE